MVINSVRNNRRLKVATEYSEELSMQHTFEPIMKTLSRQTYQTTDRPIEILQFGEGNFLRTFVDNFIQILNDQGKINMNIAVVQPVPYGRIEQMKEQDGLYTMFLEGLHQGEIVKKHDVIDVISDFINPYQELSKYLAYAKDEHIKIIFSNTTEAGIVYEAEYITMDHTPHSFPGKLLQFLKMRYNHFHGDPAYGLEIVPCELIDDNGDTLRKVILELAHYNGCDDAFIAWIETHNRFYNTLVDRIVPGYPKDTALLLEQELGYKDHSMVKGEVFHLWVIDGPKNLSHILPFEGSGLDVFYVDSIKPYKQRKVKILNGSHTALVPVAYLAGFRAVRESMSDSLISQFIKGFIFDEVVPTIDLPKADMEKFANSVLERYANPFVHHLLSSIALNSMAKFKSRVLPTIHDLNEEGIFAHHALFSLAAWITYYRGLDHKGEMIELQDEEKFLSLFQQLWQTHDIPYVVRTIMTHAHFDSHVLRKDESIGFVTKWVDVMVNQGMQHALKAFIQGV